MDKDREIATALAAMVAHNATLLSSHTGREFDEGLNRDVWTLTTTAKRVDMFLFRSPDQKAELVRALTYLREAHRCLDVTRYALNRVKDNVDEDLVDDIESLTRRVEAAIGILGMEVDS